ncbi:hypothetical protein [Alloyangia pacifica]|uniref:Uncharacterized protein n=1 Tax=Alloyangia pacifica TaxID=311180 RepID=A0A1I6VXZ3_9RHOB|nr:hypothetical protein [Alloyangia pacifica]SDI19413.1 hypothetical protein SAMN04488245_11365 [Alloyangia pacifica]SFT18572.1 hypothetical protein SAMN04488050_113158 [Alloyangia pacifica]
MKALNDLHEAMQQRRAARRQRRALRALPGGTDEIVEAERQRIFRRIHNC